MLLGCGENKDDVSRWFFECFQKCVECSSRKHVHLVDDEHLITSHLWRNASLLHYLLDIFNRVVACGIKFEDIVRPLFAKSAATLALAACLTVGCRIKTVDSFGKNACTCSLTYTARSAEQVGMSQFAALYGITQCCSKCILSHYRIERHRAVLAC